MLTDNKVLVNKHKPSPAIFCAQRKAKKQVATEEDFIRSNIESFGNDIGRTTNWITSMYEVRSHFEPGSREYEILSYRIRAGEQSQQNCIDRSKGIICKPMPRSWHDWHAANNIEDEGTRELYKSIVAEKKPYFMRYIYPSLMKEYNTYIKRANKSSMQEFGLTLDELRAVPPRDLTERQQEVLMFTEKKMPVGTGDCVMNKICRRFEQEFDGYIGRHNAETSFDYTIMKSDATYTTRNFYAIKKLYEDYNKRLRKYSIFANRERISEDDSYAQLIVMDEEFNQACSEICPDRYSLCNIILDLCYKRSSTKKFAWSMCGREMIHNLLEKNGNTISFPEIAPDGEITYGGVNFTIQTKELMEEV